MILTLYSAYQHSELQPSDLHLEIPPKATVSRAYKDDKTASDTLKVDLRKQPLGCVSLAP